MKTVAIYFSEQDPLGYPFDKAEYLETYKWFSSALKEKGVEAFFVRGDSYEGDRVFREGYFFNDSQEIEKKETIKADVIWNRDDKNTIPYITDCPIINHPEFDKLCVDKVLTAQKFPTLSPKSASVSTYEQALNTFHAWGVSEDTRVVLKKNYETEGRGIFIVLFHELREDFYDNWGDVLIQEFLDSSVGIPNVVEGLHDLRVTVVDHTPINAFLRVPKEGSFLANISQGAKGAALKLEELPSEVLDMVKEIDDQLKEYEPCLYSADFMNSDQGFKLVELNSRPGVQHPNWTETYNLFNQAIVDMIVLSV